MTNVAILGTGLIGSSVGLNLRKIYEKRPKDLVISGVLLLVSLNIKVFLITFVKTAN